MLSLIVPRLNVVCCLLLTEEGRPVFTGELDCTYNFNWQTKYACVNQTKDLLCRVTDGKKHYDLSPLTRYTGDNLLRTHTHTCSSVECLLSV